MHGHMEKPLQKKVFNEKRCDRKVRERKTGKTVDMAYLGYTYVLIRLLYLK